MKRTQLKTTKPLNRWGIIKKTGPGTVAYETWKREVALPYLLSQCRTMCAVCGTTRGLQVGHILPRSTHPHLKMELSNVRFECRNFNYYGVCHV